jgi:hypothetical protein
MKLLVSNRKDWLLRTKINVDDATQQVDEVVKELKPINKSNVSTTGSLSKQFHLTDSNIDFLNNLIAPILTNQFKDYRFKLKSAWTVYGEEYGYHTLHAHNSEDYPDICTVTYLRTPEKVDPLFPGEIYFILRDENSIIDTVKFSPEVGDLFIFPCHVFHCTSPQSKGTRQTLNLDYEPQLIEL